MNKVKQLYLIAKELGLRYVGYRLFFELKRKIGLLEKAFPLSFKRNYSTSLEDWKKGSSSFFFSSREELSFPKNPSDVLSERYNKLIAGEVCFFNVEWKNLGLDYDWITNPDSGYKYPLTHWSKIPSYNKEVGDIKYVWEKSRFCFLQDIIRYDYHFDTDSSKFVFDQIESWLEANPLNVGPNYVCSQETSLRLLNWTLALHFYKHSVHLTESVFNKIVDSIYGQVNHVEANLNFSRYLVRNNHAITECFMLYFAGVIFPFFKESKHWKRKGKALLEKEINYQFYPDGSYIQHSHNYHRVAIQMATWYVQMAKNAGDIIDKKVLKKLGITADFLQAHMQPNGSLPNYGANDGALFFKFSDTDYTNFKPQIASFSAALGKSVNYTDVGEDMSWYGLNASTKEKDWPRTFRADHTGYYVLRNADLTVYVRCGNHPDRPSQADNLHIDIWRKGENIFWDTGSYKYNTSYDEINFFWGTLGHNTLQVGKHNQMVKGSRFLWHYWTQRSQEVKIVQMDNTIVFEGEIVAYSAINSKIRHHRKVELVNNEIKIVDTLVHKPQNKLIFQNWHLNPAMQEVIELDTSDEIKQTKSTMSRYYGLKSESVLYQISSNKDTITTTIRFK